MKSERVLVAAFAALRLPFPELRFAAPVPRDLVDAPRAFVDVVRDLVAVLATAPSDSRWPRLSLPGSARMWLDRRRDARGGAPTDEPQHDRLRPGARLGDAGRAGRNAAGALRSRRALARDRGAVSSLCPGLAHVRGGPRRRGAPGASGGLVGARVAAGHRDRDRRHPFAVTGNLAAGCARRPRTCRGRKPRDGDRVRPPREAEA